MKPTSLASEILQGLIAFLVVGATILILLYQVVNKLTVAIPDVLAGFDGVVITFYFARAGIQAAAQSASNGTAQGFIAAQASAAASQPPTK